MFQDNNVLITLTLSKGFVNTCVCKHNRNTLKIASKYYRSRKAKAHYENTSKTESWYKNAKTLYKLLENSLRVVAEQYKIRSKKDKNSTKQDGNTIKIH